MTSSQQRADRIAAAKSKAQAYLDSQAPEAVAAVRAAVGDNVQDIASELGYESEACRAWRRQVEAAFSALTVNGIIYESAAEAAAVRNALEAEGIGDLHPCTPAAVRALKKHGVIRTPHVGESWGCGCEFGVIEKFTAESRAVIRQTAPGGLVAVGKTFELPIHVLSQERGMCG